MPMCPTIRRAVPEELDNWLPLSSTRTLGRRLLNNPNLTPLQGNLIKQELNRRAELMRQIPRCDTNSIFQYDRRGDFESFTNEYSNILQRYRGIEGWKDGSVFMDYDREMLEREGKEERGRVAREREKGERERKLWEREERNAQKVGTRGERERGGRKWEDGKLGRYGRAGKVEEEGANAREIGSRGMRPKEGHGHPSPRDSGRRPKESRDHLGSRGSGSGRGVAGIGSRDSKTGYRPPSYRNESEDEEEEYESVPPSKPTPRGQRPVPPNRAQGIPESPRSSLPPHIRFSDRASIRGQSKTASATGESRAPAVGIHRMETQTEQTARLSKKLEDLSTSRPNAVSTRSDFSSAPTGGNQKTHSTNQIPRAPKQPETPAGTAAYDFGRAPLRRAQQAQTSQAPPRPPKEPLTSANPNLVSAPPQREMNSNLPPIRSQTTTTLTPTDFSSRPTGGEQPRHTPKPPETTSAYSRNTAATSFDFSRAPIRPDQGAPYTNQHPSSFTKPESGSIPQIRIPSTRTDFPIAPQTMGNSQPPQTTYPPHPLPRPLHTRPGMASLSQAQATSAQNKPPIAPTEPRPKSKTGEGMLGRQSDGEKWGWTGI